MATSSSSKPTIVLLTLDKADFYNDMYEDFNTVLKSKADVEHVTSLSAARDLFTRDPKPAVILSADESLTVSTRTSLAQDALSYVRSGGILVFIGLFSSFSRPPDINRLFSHLDMPWRSGSYHRTTFELNPGMTHFNTGSLAASYSQKALHVAEVEREDAVYLPALPADGSRIESPIRNRTEAPAAFATVGEGKVGYIGDVNNEAETPPVILGMCGL